jgi:hypothetical protein
MAAESGSATQLEGTHDSSLAGGQGSRVLLAICIAIATQHVPDFQPGAIHRRGRSEMLRCSRSRL